MNIDLWNQVWKLSKDKERNIVRLLNKRFWKLFHRTSCDHFKNNGSVLAFYKTKINQSKIHPKVECYQHFQTLEKINEYIKQTPIFANFVNKDSIKIVANLCLIQQQNIFRQYILMIMNILYHRNHFINPYKFISVFVDSVSESKYNLKSLLSMFVPQSTIFLTKFHTLESDLKQTIENSLNQRSLIIVIDGSNEKIKEIYESIKKQEHRDVDIIVVSLLDVPFNTFQEDELWLISGVFPGEGINKFFHDSCLLFVDYAHFCKSIQYILKRKQRFISISGTDKHISINPLPNNSELNTISDYRPLGTNFLWHHLN